MKIRRKAWRWWVRRLILDLIPIVAMAALFNFSYAFWRVEGEEMAPALRDGDLLLLQKFGASYASGDIVLSCNDNGCEVLRIVAMEGDDVEMNAGGELFVNSEKKFDKLGAGARGEIETWRMAGGFLVSADAWKAKELEDNLDSLLMDAAQSKMKVVGVLRLRGF